MKPGVRAYFATSRWLQRTSSLAKAVLDGVWLGLLDDEALREVDEAYYARARQYLDPAFNRRGLWSWEAKAIDAHFRGRKRLIVTACGGGRELHALAARGHEVIGYECNARLVEAARALLPDVRIETMRPSEWPAAAPKADGVVVGWSSYMLMRGRERRVAFLRGARGVLEPGAPLLVSFISRPAETTHFRVSAGVGRVVERLSLRRVPTTEVGDTLLPNFMHHFDDGELGAELRDAGFSLTDAGRGSGLSESDYGWGIGLAS